MAGTMRMRAGAAAMALVMMLAAGQAMAITIQRAPTKPIGGIIGWTQWVRMQTAAGLTLPGTGITLTSRGRTTGTYGRAGWGTFRLRQR